MCFSKYMLCSPRTDGQTDTQTQTNVTTVGTLSGFQEFFLQPIIKDRPNMRDVCCLLHTLILLHILFLCTNRDFPHYKLCATAPLCFQTQSATPKPSTQAVECEPVTCLLEQNSIYSRAVYFAGFTSI